MGCNLFLFGHEKMTGEEEKEENKKNYQESNLYVLYPPALPFIIKTI